MYKYLFYLLIINVYFISNNKIQKKEREREKFTNSIPYTRQKGDDDTNTI